MEFLATSKVYGVDLTQYLCERRISMIKARWEQLAEALKGSSVSGIVLMPGPNMFYMAGLSMGLSERPTLLVVCSDGKACFVMPKLERQKGEMISQRLKNEGVNFDVAVYSYTDEEGPGKAFNEALKSPSGTWALEYRSLRMLEYSLMKRAMGDFSWVDAGEIMKELRMVKDQDELSSMQEAARLADLGAGLAKKMLAPGKRASEIALEIEGQLKLQGAQAVGMSLATGVDTAIPHAGTSSSIIESGDLAWLDLCANVNGYWSDITRTYAIGKISNELRKIYEIVVEAQEHARMNTKPGMSGAEVDALARDVIASYGYGDRFIHRTGHGLGLEIHEEPYVVASNKTPLPVGSTFTIEPGIYLPGKGGVRVEDDVVLTPSGARSLTCYPRNLLDELR
jgi:Xaa-Pro dipeptidase